MFKKQTESRDISAVYREIKTHFKTLLSFQFYEQFDDDEIGALDNAELEGFIEPDSARLEEVIKEYFREKERE